MAEPRPSRVLIVVLVVIVVAAGAGGAALLYYETHPANPHPQLTVQVGDNVTVNYIGVFDSGPQIGHVFDTSEYSVALNNVSWPKSLQYSSRGGSPSDYSPLGVYVGGNGPPNGYTIGNVTFGSVVPGFWQGLIGLPGNQTKYVLVPPNLGYPAYLINQTCYVTQPLTYSIPVTASLTPAEFATEYPNATASAGAQFVDPTYGWPDLVFSANSSAVVVTNLPTLGWVGYPNSWGVKVTNVTATNITLTNQLGPSQAGTVLGHVSGTGVCGTNSYIVSQVNLGAGTYVQNYGSASSGNKQVYGQTLIFIVTVVDILP
jgi:FKBP-type peptidyl-prolyl cis-trans isomerase